MKRFVTFEPTEEKIECFDTLEEATTKLKIDIDEIVCNHDTIPYELSGNGVGAFVAEIRMFSRMKRHSDNDAEVNLVPSISECPAESVIDEVRNERIHQRGKGYDEEHDDTQNFEFFRNTPFARPLIGGAIAFLRAAKGDKKAHESWPWERVGLQDFIPPDSQRDALIKAAAMLIAEVERMDRMKAEGRME